MYVHFSYSGFTGIDSPYEPPNNPECVVKSGEDSIAACVTKVVKTLESRGILRASMTVPVKVQLSSLCFISFKLIIKGTLRRRRRARCQEEGGRRSAQVRDDQARCPMVPDPVRGLGHPIEGIHARG